jgi:cytochrome c
MTDRDMFDTMTLTKALGGLCGMFLIFLLANWASEGIYGHGGGHGEGEATHAYIIEAADDGGAETEVEAPVDITPLLAAADVAAGETVYKKCSACHKLDGTDGTGPHLNGVIGRDIGSIAGFGYSEALLALEGNWDPQPFSEFLTDSKKYAPGTKMNIKLPKPEDRANLIAYLQSKGG